MADLREDTLQTDTDIAELTIGTALKSVRESKGLSLAEVSARIKYSVVQLGFLEQEKWDRLPKGVPLRGFVLNYAKYLETDTEAILHLLDDAVGLTKPNPSVKNLGKVNPVVGADEVTNGEPAYRTWIWVLIILVLLCVFGVYAINQGWIPDEWLIFDWLKSFR